MLTDAQPARLAGPNPHIERAEMAELHDLVVAGWLAWCDDEPRPASVTAAGGWDLAAYLTKANGLRSSHAEAHLIVHTSEVRVGMTIRTPEYLAEFCPRTRVTVEEWHYEGGETLFRWAGGCSDPNVADLGIAQMTALIGERLERATCKIDRFRS